MKQKKARGLYGDNTLRGNQGMNLSKWNKKGFIRKGYFSPVERVKYIKVIHNKKIIKIARQLFKGNSIEKVKSLINKAGLKPITFIEVMLLINGPYGGLNDLEKGSMHTFARELINLNNYYTDFRKAFGVDNYEICNAIGARGSGNTPIINSLNSPKYVGFTQVTDDNITIQAKTTLNGYNYEDQHTFYPSYTYSPNFVTKTIIKSVKSGTISRKHYIGFGKE